MKQRLQHLRLDRLIIKYLLELQIGARENPAYNQLINSLKNIKNSGKDYIMTILEQPSLMATEDKIIVTLIYQ